jgi:bifunctional non-homologous end joining protein LigD
MPVSESSRIEEGQMGQNAEDMKRCRWLKPKLLAAIEFLEWTVDNHLRHPKFVSLRDDKLAQRVTRESTY